MNNIYGEILVQLFFFNFPPIQVSLVKIENFRNLFKSLLLGSAKSTTSLGTEGLLEKDFFVSNSNQMKQNYVYSYR